jgi:quinol monooxygenase YgiN
MSKTGRITTITILFHVTVKGGTQARFHELAAELTESTRHEDEGCLSYIWHQREDNPDEFVLYEQWQDQSALDAHIEHLQARYGPPAPGQVLPAAILDLCENTYGISYNVIC